MSDATTTLTPENAGTRHEVAESPKPVAPKPAPAPKPYTPAPKISTATPDQIKGLKPQTAKPKASKPKASKKAAQPAPKPAAQPAAKKPTTKKASNMKASSTQSATRCMCGCKEFTSGGRFRPGHDARYKGVLQRAHRDGKLSAQQKEDIKSLGWDRFVYGGDKAENKSGLSVQQVNILRQLQRARNGLTRSDISASMLISTSLVVELGPTDKKDIPAVEKKSERKTLLGAKMVTAESDEIDDKTVIIYRITDKGREAIKSL